MAGRQGSNWDQAQSGKSYGALFASGISRGVQGLVNLAARGYSLTQHDDSVASQTVNHMSDAEVIAALQIRLQASSSAPKR